MTPKEEKLRNILKQEFEAFLSPKEQKDETHQIHMSTINYIRLFHPTPVELVDEDDT